MEEKEEKEWLNGWAQAYREMLTACARNLGSEDPLAKAAAIIAEKHDAIGALNSLRRRFWIYYDLPDNPHLADLINLIQEDLVKSIDNAFQSLLDKLAADEPDWTQDDKAMCAGYERAMGAAMRHAQEAARFLSIKGMDAGKDKEELGAG